MTANEGFEELGAALDELRDVMYEEYLYRPWRWLAKLVGSVRQWLIKVIGGVTNAAWRNAALEWEGIARDYGARLRDLGDAEWVVEYRGW